jgi:hypothetical protein
MLVTEGTRKEKIHAMIGVGPPRRRARFLALRKLFTRPEILELMVVAPSRREESSERA